MDDLKAEMQNQIDSQKESNTKLQLEIEESQKFNEKHIEEMQAKLELATGEQAKNERELADEELSKAKLIAAGKDQEIQDLQLKIEKIQLDFDRKLKERDLIGDEFKQSFNSKLEFANDENKRLVKAMKQIEADHDFELIEYSKNQPCQLN